MSAEKQEIQAVKTIYAAPEGQDARLLAEHARAIMPDDRVLCHIGLSLPRLYFLKEAIGFFAPDVDIIILPGWDCLPYDRVSPNSEIVATRVDALSRLLVWRDDKRRKPRILLTTIGAALQKIMPHDVLRTASFQAQKGGRVDIASLQNFLSHNGYMRTQTVREAGEYAIRGGIIDLFPPGYESPLRLDLFGDEVESIKAFDAESQRTTQSVELLSLKPASEFFLDDDSITRFRKSYREHFGVVKGDDPLYEAVSEGRRFAGMEHWLPLFFDKMDNVFDYMVDPQITMDYTGLEAAQERIEQIEDFYASRKTLAEASAKNKNAGSIYHPLPPHELYVSDLNILGGAAVLSPFANPHEDPEKTGLHAKKGRDFADIRALPDSDVFEELKIHMGVLRAQGVKPVIAAYSEGAKERLKTLMESAGIRDLVDCPDAQAIKKLHSHQTGLIILALERGFAADDIAVITEQDILGDRLIRKSKKKKKADNFLTEVSSLAEGDLVVHMEHGVGKFIALETLEAAGRAYDCLKIEYAGGDKLYVPVINMEVLSRFGSDEGTTQLDKLGGAGWQARKARVKKNLMEMADGLLKIAAARQLKKAEKLDISSDLYNEFAARFPYAETEDQDRAIKDVLADLSSETPMDRLVCGDVGFGKTEVAIRAAYVAAMAGAQVALVAPTTLLARQHYQNFMARFSGCGLRIEQLSRLVKAADAKRVKDSIRDGTANIVIGTHALFSKDIKFDHLGLLIVDEEQRFGVKQKERLKELKSDIHVLTLTATPIPRTLQMSLTGVKEMSLITTPPVDRMAIRSFVMPQDEMVIREALRREYHRGGQSFYVVPRISDIKEIEEMLAEIVPEMKVIAAHGQMAPGELEDRMTAFYEGRYDILLATNIIESGIDIPSANTMIVHRADMFGLAQLYQIRGRIGRSKIRAYAYLTYMPKQILAATAQKRLEVMETLDTLGAGFQLASHDMDIRGSGNLLGDQQSGHIKEVGVELYQQMLEEAVAAAREGLDWEQAGEANWSPQINLGTSVLIPDHYVEDLGVRMSLYRRLQDLDTPQDIESFAAEMIDRFGDLPDEVQNLLDIVAIKQLCKQAGISEIEAGPKGAVFAFYNNAPPNLQGLMGWVQNQRGSVKLRPDQKLVAMRAWENTQKRVQGTHRLMKELANL